MEHLQEFEHERIAKLLLKFTLPSIVGLLVIALYNMVDRIFVGHGVGPLGLTGLTMCFPVMLIQSGVGVLIGCGGAALMSLSLGEQKTEMAERVLGNMVLLTLVCSVTITVIGVEFTEDILRFFHTSPDAMAHALPYLKVVLAGTLMINTCIVMNMSIRSQGSPQIAMVIMMTGAMINIILDPIFIWVFHMGTAGAAWATVISQMISATMGIGYHFSARSTLKIRFQTCLPDMTLITRIVPLGFSPFIMDIAGSVQNGMLNAQLQHYGGDMAVAAIGIIFAVSTLLMMVNFGITDGLQPIVGYNYGAGRYDRVKQTVRMACFWAFGSTFAGICLIELFPSMFARLFCGDSPELVSLASHGMRIFLACFPLVGIQLVGTRYFQAIGKAGTATLFGLLRPVFLFVPLLFWLSHFWGLSGLWSTAPLTDTLAALVTVAWLARALRKLQPALTTCPSIAERRDIR